MDESPRFSRGAEQQAAAHLHFQRPAPSASPPPGRAGDARVYPRTLRLWGSRGRPARLSQAPNPTPPSRAPAGRLCLDGHLGTSVASVRASRPKWGQKGPTCPSGSAIKGRLEAGRGRRGSGWAAGTAWDQGRAAGNKSTASGGAGRGQGVASRPRLARWPFATGSRAGGKRKDPATALASSCPRGPPGRERGPRTLRNPRSSSRFPRARGVPAGGGLERGRRRGGLPSPHPRPRRLLPSSRLARGGRHRPSRGRRAKWRPSDRLARQRRARKPRRATPPGPRPPKRPP